MKTKELIRQLQEADPSGDLECCVGNVDIFFVDTEPAYYDGCLQVLRRDPAKAPYYDIVGAAYVGEGTKVVIHDYSISDAITSNPDLPVEYIGSSAQRYREAVEEKRKGTHRMDGDIALSHFENCMWKRCSMEGIHRELSRIHDGKPYHWQQTREAIRDWFTTHGIPEEPLPKGFRESIIKREWRGDKWWEVHPSPNDTYERWWEHVIRLSIEDGRLVITRIDPPAEFPKAEAAE